VVPSACFIATVHPPPGSPLSAWLALAHPSSLSLSVIFLTNFRFFLTSSPNLGGILQVDVETSIIHELGVIRIVHRVFCETDGAEAAGEGED
jgi:hypothetical protein